jgi:phosphoribosyl 1,2-cyclic phosphodiesterase
MLKFYSLASGSKGNVFLIFNGEKYLQIDCGMTRKYIFQQYENIGISIDDISSILITHKHSDHIKQLNTYKNKNIYSFANIEMFEYQKLIPFKEYSIDDYQVVGLPLSHDSENTMGFVISYKNEKLVYITDTGYLKEDYYSILEDADYVVLESNHDVKMLMGTSRPWMTKQRIASDNGHLCNEDCAIILSNIVGKKTKLVCLAHISEEANTKDKALKVNVNKLIDSGKHDLLVVVLEQNHLFDGGKHEKRSMVSDRSAFTMEYIS